MSVDVDGPLLDQLLTDPLLLKGDEAEVFRLVALHLVNRSDNLGHHAKLGEVVADLNRTTFNIRDNKLNLKVKIFF